jgi:D-threo-aldose 1-dehydrogenase
MMGHLNISGSTVTISRIGFGCARIYAGSEFRRSARLIEAALAAGIRHFDTAPMYGYGQSEDVLAQVLNGITDITVATKVGIPRPALDTARRPIGVAYRRFVHPLLTHLPGVKSQLRRLQSRIWPDVSPSRLPRRRLESRHIRFELTESLSRLKRDRVDLYLVHEPDQFDLDDEALDTFNALRRERLIGAFGLAYGRSITEYPEFGTVVQSRYDSDVPSQQNSKSRIFHGVIRHGWNHSNSRACTAPEINKYIANILESSPNVGILFSPSSVRQIKQVTAPLK